MSISASKGYKIKFVGYVKSGGDVWEQTPKKPKSSMKIKDAEQLTVAQLGNREFFVEFVGPRGEKIAAELFVSLLPVEDGKPPRSLVAGFRARPPTSCSAKLFRFFPVVNKLFDFRYWCICMIPSVNKTKNHACSTKDES